MINERGGLGENLGDDGGQKEMPKGQNGGKGTLDQEGFVEDDDGGAEGDP